MALRPDERYADATRRRTATVREQRDSARAVALNVVVPGPERYADVLVTPLVVFLIYGSLRGVSVADVKSRSYGLAILCSLGVSYVLLPFGGIRAADALLAGDALTGMTIVLAAVGLDSWRLNRESTPMCSSRRWRSFRSTDRPNEAFSRSRGRHLLGERERARE